jgi:ABC-type dipeptide/oligopeptide/nickel transport system permease component
MPTIALSVFSIAFITRMTRSSLLETIQQDYVARPAPRGCASASCCSCTRCATRSCP